MRVAWWSPLPPQRSGIADLSYDLLAELAGRLELVAVVDDAAAAEVSAPDGIPVVGATAYAAGQVGRFDLDVYHVGNHFGLHRYMHRRILDHPGLLVLHDPAMPHFYAELAGGWERALFLEEAQFSDPGATGVPSAFVGTVGPTPELLYPMLSRRLVEASVATIVHSTAVRDDLLLRGWAERLWHTHLPAASRERPRRLRDEVVIGVFGGFGRNKRIPAVVTAFAAAAEDVARARMLIVGRREDREVEREVRDLVHASRLDRVVRIACDVPLETLEQAILGCDVAVALRWPTTGETSAVVMRALGAGKPVIVSDVPQYRDLDAAFCWRVPTEPEGEAAALEDFLRRALADPDGVAASGQAARAFVEAEASFPVAASRYATFIAECAREKLHATARPVAPALGATVNMHADWSSTRGLSEAARRSAGALVGAGVPLSATDFPISGAPRSVNRAPAWWAEVSSEPTGVIDLWFLNVNEFRTIEEHQLRPPGRQSYVISSWFWELPRLATVLVDQVRRVDEIWVGSSFTADAFRGHTDRPVHVIPPVVEPRIDPGVTRADFGLPEGVCLLLFSFDADSTFARKNPWGVIQAFREAFSPEERGGRARLVLKTMNLDRYPEVRARLYREMTDIGGTLVETDLADGEMAALISLCDVYVSLHRSEGFGLGMAEAMFLGRPVVATGYSGNMDFMTQANSCPVGYRLRAIEELDHHDNPLASEIYEAGQLQAEADLGQAARFMRRLYESPAERRRLGSAASATIRARYSAAAAAAAMTARLEEIGAIVARRSR